MSTQPPSPDAARTAPRREPPAWMRRVGLGSWYFIGFCGAVALLAFVIVASRSITVPLILGIFLGVALAPVVDWMARRRVPRSLGAGLVVVLILAVFVGIVALVGIGLAEQGDDLEEQIDAAVADIKDWLAEVEIDEKLADRARDSVNDGTEAATSGLANAALGVVNSAVAVVSGAILGLIILYYLLKDGESITSSFIDSQPESRRELLSEMSQQSTDSIQAYAKGQTAIALLNGAVMGLAALVLDIPLPFSIFLVNFIGAYIPYIGAFVGGAFAALLALAVGGIGLAIAIIVVALAMNLLLENAVQPKLVGDKMDLHPLLVLLATVAGGLLAGMVGLILAAPITAIALNVYRDLRAAGYFD